METMTVRPLHAEMLLDEIGAVAIHVLSELDGFILAIALSLQPAHLALERSIEKDMKCICARLEVIRGATSHNHTISLVCGCLHNSFRNLADAIGVHYLQSRGVQTSFVAAAHKGPEEPVENWV